MEEIYYPITSIHFGQVPFNINVKQKFISMIIFISVSYISWKIIAVISFAYNYAHKEKCSVLPVIT